MESDDEPRASSEVMARQARWWAAKQENCFVSGETSLCDCSETGWREANGDAVVGKAGLEASYPALAAVFPSVDGVRRFEGRVVAEPGPLKTHGMENFR